MGESLPRLLRDMRKAERQGTSATEWRRRTRLADLVAFARTHSPYYRDLYRHLPDRMEDAALLPVVDKQELMANFDDWVTDREITIGRARAFIHDPARVGERFLGKYLMSMTSGTSGDQGLILTDDRSRAVATALSIRTLRAGLSARDVSRIIAQGGRIAVLVATNGHTTGHIYTARMRKVSRLLSKALRVFPVHTPLPELVTQLNAFRPAVLSGYASMMALLASEQEAGRLRIRPVVVQPTSEGLADAEYARIAAAFDTKVHMAYSATECAFMTCGCAHGSLHVNDDWVVLEAVDAAYRPVPPGSPSHTVLLSNLANRVQPIIRYDLGDSILQRPAPCPCGSPLPVIRVRGRAADVLTFPGRRGAEITISSIAVDTMFDHFPGIEQFQVAQTAPAILRVRLRPTAGADPDGIWQEVRADLARVLAEYCLDHVTVERAGEPPQQDPGGKYRTVIPLS